MKHVSPVSPVIFLICVLGVSAQLTAPLSCPQSGSSGPTYSVSLDGSPLFSNSPPLFAYNGGAVLTGFTFLSTNSYSDQDALGSFSGTQCVYARASAPATPFLSLGAFSYASAAASPSTSLVRFTYSFLAGATATNHSAPGNSSYSTLSNFPAFSGPTTPLPNMLTWRDAFFAPSNTVSDALGQIASAAIFYGADVAGRVVALGPLDNFLNHAMGDDLGGGAACSGSDAGCWVAGVSATVTELPAGFTHSVLLVADAGVTKTVDAWGRVMRAFYGGAPKIADTSLTTLGYQTDNGAQLCFGCPGQVLDTCLLDECGNLTQNQHVPLNYLSFQNAWWEAGSESAPWCVGTFTPVPHKVPMGMAAFQKALGLPLQLYAPYFCADSPYPQNFSMVRSDTSLPGCNHMDFYDAAPEASRDFYEFLLSLGQDYGMTMFEPDFLNANHVCVPRFIEQVGAAAMFFDGQTGVALDKGIPIQWCFCTSMLLMYTLTAPAVTNFRVSYDFYYGGSWDIGRSSLIVWAMGGKPSKDTFWTSDNGNQSTTRGGCDKKGCPPDHSTPAATLHTMLALMSTGPVGFSDAPGETNAELILRTCNSNGTLLQPSKPITACDSTHDANGGPDGYALNTYTSIGGKIWMRYLVTHQLKTPFSVMSLDLYPMIDDGAYAYTSWDSLLSGHPDYTINGAPPRSPHDVLFTLPAVAAGDDPFYPTLTLIVPSHPLGGFSFLGEYTKFATISEARFPSEMQFTPTGIEFTMAGTTGETVSLAWWSFTNVMKYNNVTLTASRAHCTINTDAISCVAAE